MVTFFLMVQYVLMEWKKHPYHMMTDFITFKCAAAGRIVMQWWCRAGNIWFEVLLYISEALWLFACRTLTVTSHITASWDVPPCVLLASSVHTPDSEVRVIVAEGQHVTVLEKEKKTR